VLECVVNVSEGRDDAVLHDLARAAGSCLLDVHRDPDHHRSVLTLAGADVEESARTLAGAAVDAIDLRDHRGVHPRLGAVDVVPFVPLHDDGGPDQSAEGLRLAVAARDRFARWAADELDLPCFLYGPERTLPDVWRGAFTTLTPDTGPSTPHRTAGACAVGARHVLVAYNVWLDTADLSTARSLAAAVRGPRLRTLGLATGGVTQVSCNLVDPLVLGPADALDAVQAAAHQVHVTVTRGELVGLAPKAALDGVDPARLAQLGLDAAATLEARLAARR